MDLIDLLTNGKVDEFNQKRGHRAALDLFAADLSNLPLSGVDLSGANLQKADLSGSDLTDAVLAKADLSGADLTGTTLRMAMGIRCKLREAYCGEADLSDMDLTGADLTEIDLTKANVARSTLANVRMKNAEIEEADFTDCDFSEAKLSGSTITRTKFNNTILRQASLNRCTLKGCDFTASDMTQVRMSGADLTESNLDQARLASADLTGSDFTGCSVKGTDFTRADLTEAILEGVSLNDAVITHVAGIASGEKVSDQPEVMHIEDPDVALNKKAMALLWDNAESETVSRLRVAVVKDGADFDKRAVALPIPHDLVLASGIAAHGTGFAAVALLERPGGVAAAVTFIGANGKIKEHKAAKLGFTPAAKPVLASYDGVLHMYAISREGPGVQVLQWGESEENGLGFHPIHAARMSTARGFASNHNPVLLTKGGIVVPVGQRGPKEPVRIPNGFPGRACASAILDNGAVAFAWLGRGEGGYRFAIGEPGRAPEEGLNLKKQLIGTLDVTADGDTAWLIYTLESSEGVEPATAWAIRLPDGQPFAIADGPDTDVVDVRFASGAKRPTAVVSTLDGTVFGFELLKASAKQRWKVTA